MENLKKSIADSGEPKQNELLNGNIMPNGEIRTFWMRVT
jgi:hypothetical protein